MFILQRKRCISDTVSKLRKVPRNNYSDVHSSINSIFQCKSCYEILFLYIQYKILIHCAVFVYLYKVYN